MNNNRIKELIKEARRVADYLVNYRCGDQRCAGCRLRTTLEELSGIIEENTKPKGDG